MVFIYSFNPHSPYFTNVGKLFAVAAERHELLSSLFVKAELLVHPIRLGDEFSTTRIDRLFETNVQRLLPFDDFAAREFASLRAALPVKEIDALHLAVAAADGADLFVTNDDRLQRLKSPRLPRVVGIEEALHLL